MPVSFPRQLISHAADVSAAEAPLVRGVQQCAAQRRVHLARRQETERDHLALRKREAAARVIVTKAVGGQPPVDVAGLPRLLHLWAEDVDLCLHSLLQPGLCCGRGLPLERERDAAACKHLVCGLQKRQSPSAKCSKRSISSGSVFFRLTNCSSALLMVAD